METLLKDFRLEPKNGSPEATRRWRSAVRFLLAERFEAVKMKQKIQDFGLEPKNGSPEATRRWRLAVRLVKNPRRRFLYLAERFEAEKMKQKIQDFGLESKNGSPEATRRWRLAVRLVKNPRRRFLYLAERFEAEKMKQKIQDFGLEPKNGSPEATRRWRLALAVRLVKNPRRRFLYLAERFEAEKMKQKIQVDQQNYDAANSISFTMDFSQWEKTERIGAGRYGIVHRALNSLISCKHLPSHSKYVVSFVFDGVTGKLCAVKEMFDIGDPQTAEYLKKEIRILSQLKHPNIVKYYGNEIVGSQISLYMEYVKPGSLKEYIRSRGALQESLVRNFTAQILSGLVYLHNQRLVHRDIKPDNLLVNSYNMVKLVDFGLAKRLDLSMGMHSASGTPYYAAPEVIGKIEYNSLGEASAADIWSLGCVIIEMFTGRHPWFGFQPVQAMYSVCCKKRGPQTPEELSAEGKDFLELCFTRNPAERPTARALRNHPFVRFA